MLEAHALAANDSSVRSLFLETHHLIDVVLMAAASPLSDGDLNLATCAEKGLWHGIPTVRQALKGRPSQACPTLLVLGSHDNTRGAATTL